MTIKTVTIKGQTKNLNQNLSLINAWNNLSCMANMYTSGKKSAEVLD